MTHILQKRECLMLELYSHPNSTYTHRIHIFLKYKSIPYDIIHVALDKLENRKRPFLAINPHGKVPVLKDEQFILSESTAIMRYVEEKFPESLATIPKDLESRAKMNQFANQCETEFCIPASIVYFAKRFVNEEKWDLNRMKDSTKRVGRHLEIMDSYLATTDFMVENTFGFVDIMYAPFIRNISYVDIEIPGNVKLWIDRVLNQAVVKAFFETLV